MDFVSTIRVYKCLFPNSVMWDTLWVYWYSKSVWRNIRSILSSIVPAPALHQAKSIEDWRLPCMNQDIYRPDLKAISKVMGMLPSLLILAPLLYYLHQSSYFQPSPMGPKSIRLRLSTFSSLLTTTCSYLVYASSIQTHHMCYTLYVYKKHTQTLRQ